MKLERLAGNWSISVINICPNRHDGNDINDDGARPTWRYKKLKFCSLRGTLLHYHKSS